MAQAFTKEIDDAPPPPAPERPIGPHRNLVTRRGAALIEREAERLGALVGSGPDKEAEAALARDLRYWLARRASMEIAEPGPDETAVGFGMEVRILRRGRPVVVRIVGEDEADPASGLIAWTAPLARALDGAEAGDTVAFRRGGEEEPIEILSVEPAGQTST